MPTASPEIQTPPATAIGVEGYAERVVEPTVDVCPLSHLQRTLAESALNETKQPLRTCHWC